MLNWLRICIFTSHFTIKQLIYKRMIEKSKVFEALKAEYAENPLVSERTINTALERMMRYTNDDTKEDEFLDDVKAILKEAEGNARKVAADTAKKVKTETKPTTEPKPKTEEEPPKTDDTPAWMDKLLSKLESYDKRFAEEDKRKTAEQVKTEAIAKVKIYPQNVIDVAVYDFDFSQEGATEKFVEKVGKTAGMFGITPEKGEPKEQKPDFSKLRAELESNDALLK